MVAKKGSRKSVALDAIHRQSLPWPALLSSDSSWKDQLIFYLQLGYRIILDQIQSLLGWKRSSRLYSAIITKDGFIYVQERRGTLKGQHPIGLELWRGGFFGKGSLSRGEPTWFVRMQVPLEEQKAESLASQRRLEALVKCREELLGENCSQSRDEQQIVNKNWQPPTKDLERYILTPEETFFLAYALGILNVSQEIHVTEQVRIERQYSWVDLFRDKSHHSLSAIDLWALLCSQNSSWYQEGCSLHDLQSKQLKSHFALRYAVYHYYRSQGWVVKCGLKFAVDFVLYQKGPIFKHSDYAVIIVPVIYGAVASGGSSSMTWASMLGMTRVCDQVKKKLLLTHVMIPSGFNLSDLQNPDCLARIQIWDVTVRRWLPTSPDR